MRSHVLYKFLPLLLLLIGAHLNVYASSPNLIFRMDAEQNAPDFTHADAMELTQFLIQKFDITLCDESTLAVVINTDYGQKNMVESLYNRGYVVLNLGCERERIVFTLSKPVRATNWMLYSDSKTGDDDDNSNYYNENNLWLDEEATAKAFSNSTARNNW